MLGKCIGFWGNTEVRRPKTEVWKIRKTWNRNFPESFYFYMFLTNIEN